MDKQTFLKYADDCFTAVTAWLEEFDPDEVDFAEADGVVKIQFPDGTTFVLNRQTAADQMWFAAGVRAWHYDRNADDTPGDDPPQVSRDLDSHGFFPASVHPSLVRSHGPPRDAPGLESAPTVALLPGLLGACH